MSHQQIHAALTGRPVTDQRRSAPPHNEGLLLSAAESAALLGMSLRKFHHTRCLLPKPVVIGMRHVRWRKADLVEWVASLVVAADLPEPPQLRASKAAKKASSGMPVADGKAESGSRNAEPQRQRGLEQSRVQSNRDFEPVGDA